MHFRHNDFKGLANLAGPFHFRRIRDFDPRVRIGCGLVRLNLRIIQFVDRLSVSSRGKVAVGVNRQLDTVVT